MDKRDRTRISISAILFALIFGLSIVVLAQVPLYMNLQGQLLQKETWDNSIWVLWPVRDAELDMTFRLYSSASGGSPAWFEHHSSVATNYDGVYNVQLGLKTPLTLPSMQQYWVGIQIEDNDEMSPRLPLGSVLSALYLAQGHSMALAPNSSAPAACTGDNAGTLALSSQYVLCYCNGSSWLAVGYGTACRW